jgi:group I intron endonuclease
MHFVYITTNLLSGKQYVGSHSTCIIDDGYLGSGWALQNAIKKYGRRNFVRKELEFFDDSISAHKAERVYIEKFNTLRPEGYNISPTGGTGYNGNHSEETKKYLSDLQKGTKLSQSAKDKISALHKGVPKSEVTKQKMRDSYYPRTLSEEGRRNIGLKGVQSRVFTEEYRKKISDANKKVVHTEKWNQKVREGLARQPVVICPHCGVSCKGGNQTRWHFDNCKMRK